MCPNCTEMRYLFLSSLLALGLTASSQIPDYVPSDGLVAWWNMNGNGEDSGPFQINPVNNGYFSGADRFGNATGAFNSNETHINYGMHPEIQNESFSFAAWINPPLTWAHKTIMGHHNDGDGGATLGLFPDNRVKLHTNHWEDEGLASSEPLNAYTWTHLVGTYSQGVLSLYIDGQLYIELEGIESPNSNGENFEVGRWAGGATQYFNGLIDDVGIWNRRLDVSEILELYQSAPLVIGCTDSLACNFMPEANHDDGSCIDCSLFEERCGPGTMWDESVQLCVVANPSDTDFDSCVGMIDLLDLLSVFGTCNETPWTCGDPLEYQGYDYETVQIGEQCWFAENLRAELYQNGDAIPSALSDSLWSEVGATGAFTWPSHDNATEDLFGKLYNGWVVLDSRGVCPNGWEVPTSFQLTLLMNNFSDFASAGEALKDDVWWNGSNISGFTARPAGAQSYLNAGFIVGFGSGARMWGTSSAPSLPHLHFSPSHAQIDGNWDNNYGMSIRCIQDSE